MVRGRYPIHLISRKPASMYLNSWEFMFVGIGRYPIHLICSWEVSHTPNFSKASFHVPMSRVTCISESCQIYECGVEITHSPWKPLTHHGSQFMGIYVHGNSFTWGIPHVPKFSKASSIVVLCSGELTFEIYRGGGHVDAGWGPMSFEKFSKASSTCILCSGELTFVNYRWGGHIDAFVIKRLS